MNKRLLKIIPVLGLWIVVTFLAGCSGKTEVHDEWLESARLDADETPEELYTQALKEDVLIVYTVSTRLTEVKESFEREYPGLLVEIRDLRSPNLVSAVEENYQKGGSDCDVVICSDNSGDFKTRLADTGIVTGYVPKDIGKHFKTADNGQEGILSFVYEAEMLFYNSAEYESCPIENIWELTDEKYRNRIYMPNPLRSFSTYTLCTSMFQTESERALENAYRDYYGREYTTDPKQSNTEGTQNSCAALFWSRIAANTVFTNSSDEVVEALSNGNADFGFLVSSKMRFSDIGFSMQPVYKLEPFSGCRTSYSVSLARNSKNINTAKLFIRYLLGGEDGKGEGRKPFDTLGTWSARDDAPDGNPVALEDIDLIIPDQDFIIKQDWTEEFWTRLLVKN
ncbi:MAG: substrate-binding domain-containing protein [Lachnospiraceae bacterium]|nr:substrate-binding domain-containing protein [Lachnospiraceae bacterium]